MNTALVRSVGPALLLFSVGLPSVCAHDRLVPLSAEKRWVKAFDKSNIDGPEWRNGQGTRYYPYLRWARIYSQYRRLSPDRRYEAVILSCEGEVGCLVVFRRDARRRYPRQQDMVSRAVDDVGGCAWVPNRPHSLVFSAGGADYGTGILGVWHGPWSVRVLRHAQVEDGEGFDVRRVSADGCWIDYRYLAPDGKDRYLSLRLPR